MSRMPPRLSLFLFSFLFSFLFQCSTEEGSTAETSSALPTCFTHVIVQGTNALRDECLDVTPGSTCSVVNGNCSVREAFLAATRKQAFDQCPAPVTSSGSACTDATYRVPIDISVVGTTTIAGAAGDNDNNGGDLDFWFHSAEVNGPAGCNTSTLETAKATCWGVNAGSLDRCFHASGGSANTDVEMHNVFCQNGCANGGNCNTTVGGGTPFGGGIYFNEPGRLRVSNILIANSSSGRGGSGLATCTDSATDQILTDVRVIGGVGSSAVQSHTNATWIRLSVVGNTMNVASSWGAFDQYNRTATLVEAQISNNVNSNGDGAGVTVRGTGTARGEVLMQGGSITGNTSNGRGAGVYLAGSCAQAPGQPHGCFISLSSVSVTGNTSDAPTSAPAGSGGGVDVVGGGTYPSRLELHGSTALTGNTDASMAPTFAPDCAGVVSAYDQSVIGNTAGCVVDDHRTCGNAMLDAGEQCDGGECCTPSCTFSSNGTACTDNDACTLNDSCNAIGMCITTPACGNGVLQSTCGEECDDGNTNSSDGCHSDCMAETCIAWNYP